MNFVKTHYRWNLKSTIEGHAHAIQWLKIVLQHDNGSDEIDIPELDKSNILQYLIEWKPPIEFDCQSFIHKAKWLKMRTHWENFAIIADKRMMEKVNINELKSWDCVCTFKYFSNNNTTFNQVQHFAYYLWNWLFLSKFWTTGNLTICTMQEMHNFYWTKEFVRMKPNSNHEDNKKINTH